MSSGFTAERPPTMIRYLKGTLRQAEPLLAVVEVQGIGYEVHIPLTTAEKLPHPESEVFLHTLVVYREDSQTLYGFATPEDRDLFRTLIEKVSGIGPRIAQSILSRLSSRALRQAIVDGDTRLLSQCPGIGKKTAERLVLELKDKIGGVPGSPGPATSSGEADTQGSPASSDMGGNRAYQDALSALLALGYKPAEADKSLRRAADALGPSPSTEELIKRALQRG